jgi:glycosidase
MVNTNQKIVVYQVLPRLFGNTQTQWIPWGTKEQNGIGKFSDFNDIALSAIMDLGVTHIWLTGILHHALIGDYKAFGISDDDPDVVKGRAGSPYAIKDYYSVNPDLANDPERRNEEFKELIDRIHQHGLKVIIDIVPNHVARKYESKRKPDGVPDLGIDDITLLEYHRNNNFYYITDQQFEVPEFPEDYRPLGGEDHPLADGYFQEFPAKWTGNGSRAAKPSFTDWYETVKLNYGVRPDGTWDFETIPETLRNTSPENHRSFWENKSIPDTWIKMKDIALFWQAFGVDGFRYDMAEMVPVPFWSYLNAHLKSRNEQFLTIAEIYDPNRYYDFIELGLMDYLYDKVDLYDTLCAIMTGKINCHAVFPSFDKHYPISQHLLHFMENHDELRIASQQLAGDPNHAKPAIVISATIGKGGLMIYNGQEVGEPAEENAGFGSPGRTSIYDYIGIPKHQQWMNHGAFDGALLANRDKELRQFYQELLQFTLACPALEGPFYDLHRHNASLGQGYPGHDVYSFARWKNEDKYLILCNFSKQNRFSFRFYLYLDLAEQWFQEEGHYTLTDYFTQKKYTLVVSSEMTYVDVELEALASLILKLN